MMMHTNIPAKHAIQLEEEKEVDNVTKTNKNIPSKMSMPMVQLEEACYEDTDRTHNIPPKHVNAKGGVTDKYAKKYTNIPAKHVNGKGSV